MLKFNHTVAIKMCGITNVADALACAAAGADMLGFNFSPLSPRCVAPSTAAQIIGALRPQFPQIKFIGVFVDQKSNLVRATATNLALDAVQLHGAEMPSYVQELNLPCVIKAFRVDSGFAAAEAADFPCAAILLDTYSAALPGGTGEVFSWSLAAGLPRRRLILAGGLTSGNVAEAIRQVGPFAVDVCSGVESAPGRKDAREVGRFVERVRALA